MIATTSTTIDPAYAADLRRRRSRDIAESIVDAAHHALPDDRATIRAIYADGMSVKEVAQLRATSPRALRRHVRRTVERLLSSRFTYVLANRDDWPPTRRRVATACILQGRPLRAAAKHLRISLHAVRRQMDVINALHDANA